MASILNKSADEIFENIPDFIDWGKAIDWINEGQKLVKDIKKIGFANEEIVALDWSQIRKNAELPFGLYSSREWRKFVLSVFLADYFSYTQPVDRVSFERLLFVMHVFPEGFRTWWIKLGDGKWWPVGYTGWYPMLETAFDLFEKAPHKLKDRMVVPYVSKDGASYVYLFNYSVAAELRGSDLSKMLIKRYVEDIKEQEAAGLACVTVSGDGVRVAKRFGMSHAGDLVIDGSKEGVYTVRKKIAK